MLKGFDCQVKTPNCNVNRNYISITLRKCILDYTEMTAKSIPHLMKAITSMLICDKIWGNKRQQQMKRHHESKNDNDLTSQKGNKRQECTKATTSGKQL